MPVPTAFKYLLAKPVGKNLGLPAVLVHGTFAKQVSRNPIVSKHVEIKIVGTEVRHDAPYLVLLRIRYASGYHCLLPRTLVYVTCILDATDLPHRRGLVLFLNERPGIIVVQHIPVADGWFIHVPGSHESFIVGSCNTRRKQRFRIYPTHRVDFVTGYKVPSIAPSSE